MSAELENEPLAELREAVDRHMLRYGGDFADFLAVRAEGSHVIDHRGRSLLDFCSGQMCATLGHSHPAVVAALDRAAREAIHLFSGILSPVVIELARRLTALLPPELSKAAFLNTGGEANEIALRLAKCFTGRYEVVALMASWHGQTAGAQAATYNGGRKGYGPTVPGALAIPSPNCYRCPLRHCRDRCDLTCLEVGFELVDAQSTAAPAAVIVEPIQSSGGIIVPPEGYFRRLRELSAAREMLLIFDEAQTAFRTGTNFAFEQEGVVPDVLNLSKTLGGGLPLAATVTSAEIEEDCYAKGFMFYTSHVSDPLPAAVGLAVLDTLAEEKLIERTARMAERLMAGLRTLHQRHEAIGDVRGRGLLAGVELVGDRESRRPDGALARRVLQRALELGLILNVVRTSGTNTLRLAPPLTISEAEMDQGLEILDRALTDSLESQLSTRP